MKKPSFFERLTGSVKLDEDEIDLEEKALSDSENTEDWLEDSEGQLAVDVHQDEDSVIVKTMVAGVRPEDLEITTSRDMLTIRGKRESEHEVSSDDFFHKELYWGSFSRTIMLPCEVEIEDSEATEKHGLLTIKLPKVDKHKQAKLKVKSS